MPDRGNWISTPGSLRSLSVMSRRSARVPCCCCRRLLIRFSSTYLDPWIKYGNASSTPTQIVLVSMNIHLKGQVSSVSCWHVPYGSYKMYRCSGLSCGSSDIIHWDGRTNWSRQPSTLPLASSFRAGVSIPLPFCIYIRDRYCYCMLLLSLAVCCLLWKLQLFQLNVMDKLFPVLPSPLPQVIYLFDCRLSYTKSLAVGGSSNK